jgi:hypothetical protein
MDVYELGSEFGDWSKTAKDMAEWWMRVSAVMSFVSASRKVNNNIIIYLLTAIGLLPGGSGYFTCKQNMKLVTTKFKSGGLHEKHVVATWNLGNHLSICL